MYLFPHVDGEWICMLCGERGAAATSRSSQKAVTLLSFKLTVTAAAAGKSQSPWDASEAIIES